MPANHTPGKWQYHLGRGANPRFHIQTTGGYQIASTPELSPHSQAKIENEEREANAAFIVRACNCHDELVAVLDSIHDLPVDDEGFRTIPPGFLDAARAVLKKARSV